MRESTTLHVAVIGAGPSGLDAALACREQGWDVNVFERGDRPGHAIRGWGHVQMFTPWEMNRSSRMELALAAAGVNPPEGGPPPTGEEFAERLIDPLCVSEALAGRVHCGSEITDVAREGLSKEQEIASDERARRRFRLTVREGGSEHVVLADAVIDASGSQLGAAPLGEGGVAAPRVRSLDERIQRSIPDLPAEAARFAGKTTLLAGSGHSAQTTAAGLAAVAATHPDTTVIWAARSLDPAWGSPPDDPLPDRASLAAMSELIASGGTPGLEFVPGAQVRELFQDGGKILARLDASGGPREVRVDNLIALTGTRIDASLYSQLQVHECYATGAPINLSAQLLASESTDCLTQPEPGIEALRNPEPGFYIIGAKSFGRAPNYLMRTGFSQAEGVVAMIASDLAARV